MKAACQDHFAPGSAGILHGRLVNDTVHQPWLSLRSTNISNSLRVYDDHFQRVTHSLLRKSSMISVVGKKAIPEYSSASQVLHGSPDAKELLLS